MRMLYMSLSTFETQMLSEQGRIRCVAAEICHFVTCDSVSASGSHKTGDFLSNSPSLIPSAIKSIYLCIPLGFVLAAPQ